MNWLAVVGGSAVLVIYLAGRRAQKDLTDEPPIFGDHGGGATGTAGGGYYGEGGGGDGGGLSAINDGLAPIGSDIAPKNDNGMTLMDSFISKLGFGSLERVDAKLDLGSPSGSLTRMENATLSIPTVKSAQIGSIAASTAPMASSSLSMSSIPSTVGNAVVTSQAVQAQPVRTLSAPVATISARSVSPILPVVVAPVAPRPAPVPTGYSFLSTIGRGPNGTVIR